MPGVMRASEITSFGRPEMLHFRDLPIPVISEDEVLVRTHAIGVNFADVFARLGYYPGIPKPPFVPGIEFSGEVVAVGGRVKSFRSGEKVFGFSKQNAYAEYVATPSTLVMPMPSRMSFEEAAAFGVTSLTAYHGMMNLAHAEKGESVLVHAAAGGVGTAALQIAKHLNLKVFATVGSDEKLEFVRGMGAEVAINYSTQDFEKIVLRETGGNGVDVVMDSVGGRVFRKGWRLMAPMGRYVLFGFAAVAGEQGVSKLRAAKEVISVPFVHPPSLVSKNVGLMGFNLYFLMQKAEYLQRAMRQLLKWYEKGIVRPVIGATYPFDNIVEAHRFLQSRRSVGKVVVIVRS